MYENSLLSENNNVVLEYDENSNTYHQRRVMRAVKKTWANEEDKALINLIEMHGTSNW